MTRCLALLSGGLDSILAAKLIALQGVEVIGIYFYTPFFAGDKKSLPFPGLEIKNIDIREDFLQLIRSPRFGFGSHINPCIDCKIFMLNRARQLLSEFKADFVITGEVLGQRPMSQNRQALELIEKESGLTGLLLRPLSAGLLNPTLPQTKKWVEKDKLLNLSGRSRKPQLELAEKLKLSGYSTPAGGCLLTDPAFSRRLKDLIACDKLDLNNIELLKIGRHFRLSQSAKLIIGRNEQENNLLLKLAQKEDHLFLPQEDIAGPTSLGRGLFDDALIRLSCRIIQSHCDLKSLRQAAVLYKKIEDNMVFDSESFLRLDVEPGKRDEFELLRI